MKLKKLLEELEKIKPYKDFIKDNPKAFFSAGFFVLDLEANKTTIQLDFFIPKKKKVAAFEFPFTNPKIFEDKIEKMEKQSSEIKIDIDDLELTSEKVLAKNKLNMIPIKIIAILRDNQWNLTCMNNMLSIVRMKINALTGEETFFEKASLIEFIKSGKP